MFEKNVDVFGRGDTAEQNDLAVEGQFFRETLHVPLQRRAVTRIVFVNVYFGELGRSARPIGVAAGTSPRVGVITRTEERLRREGAKAFA